MRYHVVPPPASLAPYVRFFWILESNEPYIHQSMADGLVELIFHYQGTFDQVTDSGSETSALSLMQGPSSRYTRFETRQGFGIFGVYLYPFAIPQLLAMPSSELSDQAPDVETLFGSEGKQVEEQMLLAQTHSERIKLISAFLRKQLQKQIESELRVYHAIHSIIQSKGQVDIDRVADYCCWSRRQFERRFKYYAGFSPKLYSRIIRFQAAMDAYGHQEKSLAQIALDCGYYDQSHFSHDFKQFSGYCPGTYFSGKADGIGWREA